MTTGFWTLDRVAHALAEQADVALPRGSAPLSGISTDTRTLTPGQLFVALIGERYDAHDKLDDAVSGGATALVVSRAPKIGAVPVPVFQVHDTLVALGALARAWRRAWGRTVITVAGSNGKTTTKDLLRAALSAAYEVHATTGNLNNRIGVPLTLLATPAGADIAVVELGSNIPGEVAILRDIADADVTIVTSVAEEHLEGFGDLAGVLREETSCCDGVPVAFVPAAQPEIAEAVRGRSRRVVTVGLDKGDVTPSSWKSDSSGNGSLGLGGVTVSPPLRGVHNLQNTMLAVAVARECGVSDEAIADGISRMPAPKMRVAWEQVGRATLINDAYNSNPGSARAAIEVIRGVSADRQRVVVLGTMRELGAASDRCHDEITRIALDSGADIVAGIGEFAKSLGRVSDGGSRVVTADSVEALWPTLEQRLAPDAVILLKASRGVQLERLVPQITRWAVG
jgi:UDP-N-acetylmuramoyl-tripeptide--D-alanyl-D-alanine ligase